MNSGSRSRWTRALLAVCTLGIAALVVQAQTANPEWTKKYDAIVGRFDKAQKDFTESLKKIEDEAERDKLEENRPGEQFIPEFQTLAREAKGSDVAVNSWFRVAEIATDFGRKEDVVESVKALVDGYVTSPLMEKLPGMAAGRMGALLGKENAESALKTLAEKSPHKPVQAAALYSVATRMMNEKKASPERQAEARTILAKVQKEYTGVVNSRKQDYGVMAEAILFELDNLQIGKVAPDFEVTDENGVKFKLSDYRGKVVVLDFWGIW